MNQERKMSKQLKLNGQDSVDIGIEEDELYEKNDLSVHEHFNNTDEEIDIPDIGFFPKELVLEEQRLKEDHTKRDEESLVNDLDEREKRVRFQKLLTLLKNSTKLSNLFESRLKICKIQIIKKELGNAMTMKENVPNYVSKDESTKNTDNQSIVNPQVALQAQDRCHRMGQTKPVVVYRFCSKNTIDERILNFATAKRKLEKVIIGSGSFSRTATLTMSSIEDLMTLLKSSEYTKKIQPNGFILSDEELDAILDRSDMYNSASTHC